MPTIQLGDQSLFYFEHRIADSAIPPLLLIHGAGGQHIHWPPQVRRLKGVWTLAPDLPGHGRSEGSGRSTVAAYVADLLALIDTLGIARFIPVGHSMGGAIALQMALDEPERLAGVVLVATGARLRVASHILDNVLTNFDTVIDFVTTYAYGPSASDDLKRLTRRSLRETGPEVVHGDYLACHAFDVLERLDQITVPALVIGGTADQMTPAKYAQHLSDHIPDAELHLIETAGHMIPVEFPDRIADILHNWLSRRFEGI